MAPDSSATAFSSLIEQRDRWLAEQIRQLSVDLLSQGTFTCTACGAVAGDYIVQQDGENHRLNTPETYAFLQYMKSK